MEIDLTKEQIRNATYDAYRDDADELSQLVDDCTTTYEPIIGVFLILAKQLKDADRLDNKLYKTVIDYFS